MPLVQQLIHVDEVEQYDARMWTVDGKCKLFYYIDAAWLHFS